MEILYEFFGLTKHQDNAGANMVYGLLALTLALYYFQGVVKRVEHGIFGDDVNRVKLGWVFVMLAIFIRISPWVPWRSFLLYDMSEWANWYRDFSHIWTTGGMLFFIAGVVLIMHPALERWFSKLWPVAVFGISVTYYWTGVFVATYLAPFLVG